MTSAMMNMAFILNAGNNTEGSPSAAYSSAFIGGLINGFFGGSNIQKIYVPTWAAAALNYWVVKEYGYETVFWVTITVGLQIQILSYTKWHHLIDFMPNYTIEQYYLGLFFFKQQMDTQIKLLDQVICIQIEDLRYIVIDLKFINV